MAKRRCKKGVVKSGPRKGLCKKTARKSSARKSSKKGRSHRPNCEKFGFSVALGRCRKGPARGGRSRGGVDDSVRAAMQLANRRIYGP